MLIDEIDNGTDQSKLIGAEAQIQLKPVEYKTRTGIYIRYFLAQIVIQ